LKKVSLLSFFLILIVFFIFSTQSFAQEQGENVELNGDIIEYSRDGQTVIAKGNVIIVRGDTTIMGDRVEFSQKTNMAYANGNVRLVMPNGEIEGEDMTFNFAEMKGDFHGAKLISDPYYGTGAVISKVSDNQMKMKDSFITTCDHDKPHYGLASRKMDIYPGDKMVARNVRMFLGKIPMMFIPRLTQSLKSTEPRVTFTPGYDKEWGMFVLSSWRYNLKENVTGVVHVDARERKDIAWGIDVNYKTPKTGEGTFRTYYMNERSITSKRFFQERPSPTIEKERFKVEWRHKWEIDEKTNAIMQYYKLSDNTLLKDYFEKENDKDSSPNTFFLLTRTLPKGSLNFRTDPRINRFESAVERLPELRYDLGNQEIWNTGVYLRNITMYSNLTSKNASPSEARRKTMRLHTDSALSYPMKISFMEFNPYIGSQQTYYSRAKKKDQYNSIRGIFRTGASLSTKFYRIFDIKTNVGGVNLNRLRHIVTPSISYSYQGNPTIPFAQLDSFDGIDSLANDHSISFSIENKLQTRRNESSVDLLRFIVSAPFNLKESSSKGGFGTISADIDFKPLDWATFYFDSSYDTYNDRLSTANFDIYINGGSKWYVDLGKRWNRDVDDQLTTEFFYKLNPKWAAKTYTRFDLRSGILKEQEFTITRDLHAWEMEINFNETRKKGNEIWMIFRLKAFPDLAIDVGSSFNKRKAGSQSAEGE